MKEILACQAGSRRSYPPRRRRALPRCLLLRRQGRDPGRDRAAGHERNQRRTSAGAQLIPARKTRPNIVTTFEGIQLDWRVTYIPADAEGDAGYEAELLTPANLTDAEYARAEEEAIEAYAY